nr:MAG TPA: hypothetical protein [Caudoviricetes sp.]
MTHSSLSFDFVPVPHFVPRDKVDCFFVLVLVPRCLFLL